MKQSCRSVWPNVNEPTPFFELCQTIKNFDLAILAHPAENDILKDLVGQAMPQKALLMVGPEGGFTEEEIEAARKSGCKLLSLGPRRLRSETAGLVAATKVLAAFGQL